MKKLILIPLILLFIGCANDSDEESIQDITTATGSGTTQKVIIKQRFILEKVQKFKDYSAYNNHRDVYILTDTETNKTYVGISGVGISELGSHSSGKTSTPDER